MFRRSAVRKKGFTLIEILIVVGVLGTVAVIASQFFFSILRGSTKARLLTEAKQSGSYALGVMERMIHNSGEIVINTNGNRCDPAMTKLKIANPDQGETEFACETDKISSNSASLTSNLVKPINCSFDCTGGDPGIRPDTVEIDFTLIQAVDTGRPEEQVSIDFETTVTMRNY